MAGAAYMEAQAPKRTSATDRAKGEREKSFMMNS
jgi:hypothetical protein